MAFKNANRFTIKAGNINMVDNSSNGVKDEPAFQRLYERACHGASHKTEERFDPPKCHKETRTAVINDILSWVNSSESDQRILWMSGVAGAGKSAIAQTVAEICENDTLVASFFFSRAAAATGRDDGTRLIASLAYQMAVSIPETKPFVLKSLQDDPAILKHSMERQMQKLIVEPLIGARTAETKASRTTPVLVIIDALDECRGANIQVSIVQTIALAVSSLYIPLRFLIASRPEVEIKKTFGSHVPDAYKLVLDEKYNPDEDIEFYLRSEFNVIKREHPSLHQSDINWPSDRDIDTIVWRSSGQFIYASTVMKYINNDRKNPIKCLEVIINITPSPENPYPQLDALYTHMLSNFQHDYSLVKRLFEAILLKDMPLLGSYPADAMTLHSLFDYGDFLCVDDIALVTSDLHSILDVGERGVKFYHASFSDFLLDNSRSGRFCISADAPDAALARLCLERIQKGRGESTASRSLLYACSKYFQLLHGSPLSVAHLQNTSNSRQILETAIRHLVLNPFGFYLNAVVAGLFLYRKRNAVDSLVRNESKRPPKLFPRNYTISTKLFTVHLIPRPHRPLIVSPRAAVKDICKHVQEIFNEYALHYFKRNSESPDRSRTYLRVIYHVVLCDPHLEDFSYKHLSTDIMWLGEILECPVHGKEYFLNAENSEKVFRIIWEERRTILDDGDIFKSVNDLTNSRDYLVLPAVLHYLLKRCNISPVFRDYLRAIFPDLKMYLLNTLKYIDEQLDTSIDSSCATDCSGTHMDYCEKRRSRDGPTRHQFERDMELLLQFDYESLPKTTVPQYGKYCHCTKSEWRMSWLEKWWKTWGIRFNSLRSSS